MSPAEYAAAEAFLSAGPCVRWGWLGQWGRRRLLGDRTSIAARVALILHGQMVLAELRLWLLVRDLAPLWTSLEKNLWKTYT